jgi:hypothetical protein
MWGTVGIGINVAKVTERLGIEDLDTWDIVFKPENAAKLADCGIYLLDAPEDMIQSTLAWLGKTPDSKDPGDIEAAFEALTAVRPYIQKFHSSEYINALANGDICMAVGYSGDILQARDRAEEAANGVEIEYLIPREGAQMWFDSFVIPGTTAFSGGRARKAFSPRASPPAARATRPACASATPCSRWTAKRRCPLPTCRRAWHARRRANSSPTPCCARTSAGWWK